MPTRINHQKNKAIHSTPASGGTMYRLSQPMTAIALTAALTAAVFVSAYDGNAVAESSSSEASTAR